MFKRYRVTFTFDGYEYLLYDGSDLLYAIQILLMNSELNPVIEEFQFCRLRRIK